MERVKLIYVMKGENCMETVDCRSFSPSSIIESIERKIEDQTGEKVIVSSLHERWTDNDVLLFSFDCEGDVMSGYAFKPAPPKNFVYGIWLNGAEHEYADPDELYETDAADESAATSFFVQFMDLDVADMEKAVVRILSVQ